MQASMPNQKRGSSSLAAAALALPLPLTLAAPLAEKDEVGDDEGEAGEGGAADGFGARNLLLPTQASEGPHLLLG